MRTQNPKPRKCNNVLQSAAAAATRSVLLENLESRLLLSAAGWDNAGGFGFRATLSGLQHAQISGLVPGQRMQVTATYTAGPAPTDDNRATVFYAGRSLNLLASGDVESDSFTAAGSGFDVSARFADINDVDDVVTGSFAKEWLPDLVAYDVKLRPDGGIDWTYDINGRGRTDETFKVELYYASGASSNQLLGGPIASATVSVPANDPSPLQLGTIPQSQLASVAVPASTTGLALIVDRDNVIPEYNKGNNFKYIPLPNLTAFAPTVLANGDVQISYKVTGGSIPSDPNSPFHAQLWWGGDSGKISPISDDTLLNTNPSGIQVVTIPHSKIAAPPTGARYLMTVLDPKNIARESNENDNIASKVLSDVRIDNVRVGSGGTLGVDYHDLGAVLPKGVNAIITAFWTTDRSLTPDSVLGRIPGQLTLGTLPGPNRTAWFASNKIGDAPDTDIHGDPAEAKYLAVKVDAGDSLDSNGIVIESNESNNVFWLPLGNLFIDSFEWDNKGNAHINVGAIGSVSKYAPTLDVYWSKGSHRLGRPIFSVKKGIGTTSGDSITVPWSVLKHRPAEADNLDAVVDSKDAVIESNEEDNDQTITTEFRPTLKVPAPTQVTAADWGGSDPGDVWTMNVDITPNDGLRVSNVSMGSRFVASEMSLPYFVLNTEFENEATGELVPNSLSPDMRTRLVDYQAPHFEHVADGPATNHDPLVIRATYAVDRLGFRQAPRKSYLLITQEYRFYQADSSVVGFAPVPSSDLAVIRSFLTAVATGVAIGGYAAGSWSSDQIRDALALSKLTDDQLIEIFGGHSGPAAMFYPIVKYQYVSDDEGVPDPLVSISLPERLSFAIDGSPVNNSAIIRDADNPYTYDQIKRTIFNDSPGVTFLQSNPLQTESDVVAIRKGGRPGDWDNVHITAADKIDPPLNWDRFPNFLPPGAMDSIHIHWRWSTHLAFPSTVAPGMPVIPQNSQQAVEIGMVRSDPAEAGTLDWHALVDGQTLSGQDQTMWYEGTGYQDQDSFFNHGGFVERLDSPTPAVAPRNLRVVSTDSEATHLAWDSADGANSYTVQASDDQGVSWNDRAYAVGNDATQQVLTLDPGGQYSFRVIANTGLFSSNPSNVVSVAAPLSTPRNLRILAVRPTEADLSWDEVNGEDHYDVQVSSNGGITWSLQEHVPANHAYHDTVSLRPDHDYLFRVVAVSSAGQSNPSNVVEVHTPSDAPTNLHVISLSPVLTELAWDEVSGESSYRVDRSTDGGASWHLQENVPADHGYSDVVTELTPGTTYLFRVVAIYPYGEGDPSRPVSVITPSGITSAPSGLHILSVSPSSIQMAWNEVLGEDHYDMQVSTNGGQSWSLQEHVPADHGYLDTVTVQPNTTYLFQVVAVTPYGASDPSNAVQVTTPKGTPAVPSNLHVLAVGPTSADLAWDEVDGETSYTMQVSINGGNTWAVQENIPADHAYHDTVTLQPSRTYWFRVVANNSFGSSDPSNVVQVTTPRGTLPAPSNLRVTGVNPTSANLAWDEMSGETSYTVQVSTDGGNSWSVQENVPPDHAYNDTVTLAPGRTYLFRVVANNDFGAGDPSNVVQVTTPKGTLPAPANLHVLAVSPTSADLAWNEVDGESSYTMQVSTDGGNSWSVQENVPADHAYKDTVTLSPGRSYWFRVVANNGYGSSDPSNVVQVTTPRGTLPAPTNLHVLAIRATEVDLAWNEVSGEDSYTVQVSTDNGVSWRTQENVPANHAYKDTVSVLSKHTYWFRVVANNAYGASDPSNVVKVTTA